MFKFKIIQENVEDSKTVIRSRKLKANNTIVKRQKDKTMMYKTLHRKLKIEQHKPNNNRR